MPHPPIRKSLGQHFLTDRSALQRIVEALSLTGTETVVEIGPGRGALTELLIEKAGRVVAIEYDRALAANLARRYAGDDRLTVIQADVLETNLAEAAGGPFVLVGNVPYYITTPILFHALERPRAERSVYLVQKEVADRLAAPPGADDYGALSANVQAVANVEKLFRIPAGAFNPPPKVDSAVVRITPRPDPIVAPDEEQPFREFVQAAFGLRRKQMRRVVRTILDIGPDEADALLAVCAIPPDARPEVLTPSQFAELVRRTR